ncbi:hypothetical protein [Streptomyces tanashiensis]|uniref:hypothetical protein n=1 Tax=Streptomyces tanashiensis TaxID=67367 RepID=UPI00343D554A
MAKKLAPKHLTITIDFDLQVEGSTVTYQRAGMAYDAAVAGAIEGARRYLREEMIKEITSEMDLSYRWTRKTDTQYRRPEPEGVVVAEGAEVEEFDL